MDSKARAQVTVAPLLRGVAAVVFFIVVFLADPNGSDGVIAAAGSYALVEVTFGAAIMRATLPRLSVAALLILVPLAFGVGILPMLLPPIAAAVVGCILVLWFSLVGSAVALRASGLRRGLGAATLLCSLLALGTIALSSPRELQLLAVTAILSAASLYRFIPASSAS
jgi:hypothetical protein